jgi:biotin carboxyl carrier protein
MNDRLDLKTFQIEDTVYETQFTRKFERRRPYVAPDPKKFYCLIPGVIQKIHISPHKKVVRNEPLMVLEAMKMANDILSPVDGQIKSVLVRPGQMVLKGDLLLEFE